MAETPSKKIDIVPDPDEDDLDDLDDVLDEFQATTISAPQSQSTSNSTANANATTTAPTSSGPGRPTESDPVQSLFGSEDGMPSEQDFAKQLQAGMANLISELDANPDVQAEFEKMMQELIAAGAAPSDGDAAEHIDKAASATQQAAAAGNPSSTSKSAGAAKSSKPDSSSQASSAKKSAPAAGSAGSGTAAEDKFQDTIRRTMERMQASGDAATAATSGPDASSEDDFLAQMMRELSEGGGLGAALGGAGAGGEGGLNAMLLSMMAQLTHKDILYEPMKELNDKFPAWLTANREKESKEDIARYEEQQRHVKEIVERFERKGYSDENNDDREYIVERMQKMQAAGSPPADLVGDMNSAQEALGDLDAGCPTQ